MPYRVVFMGTPEFSTSSLKALIESPEFDVVAAYTNPDQPRGRSRTFSPTPVKELALSHDIPVVHPKNLRDPRAVEKLATFKPDVSVVSSFGHILPVSILNTPTQGSVNIHASILPELRGPSPIHGALLQGKEQTGITIMQMDEGMDTGDILSQHPLKISPDERIASLHDRLAELGASALLTTLNRYLKGNTTPTPQDHSRATLTHLIKKHHGQVNWWKQSAEQIYNQFRALNYWPGIFGHLSDTQVKFTDITPDTGSAPVGMLTYKEGKLLIGTMSGSINVLSIQPTGKSPISSKDFANGYANLLGIEFQKPTQPPLQVTHLNE